MTVYDRTNHAKMLDDFRDYLEEYEGRDDIHQVTAMWEFHEWYEGCECCGPTWDDGIEYNAIQDTGTLLSAERLYFHTLEEFEAWRKTK